MARQTKLLGIVITTFACLISLYVAAYAIWLLIIGEQRTTVVETSITEGFSQLPNVTAVEYVPYPVALIPLVAALLLLGGLLIRKFLIAWIGLAILIAFSLLFLFSSGGALLPWVAILFGLLGFDQYYRRKTLRIN